MKNFLSFVLISIIAVPVLMIADEKPGPAALKAKPSKESADGTVKDKAPDEPAPISVKNKSSFQVDAGVRSPFWPIGFKPKGRIGGAGDAAGEVPASAFLVSSITLDNGTRFAIINGRTMAEGQQFGLQVGTQIYQVTVKRIEDGQVILGRHDEEIVVPLRRK
jgi:hypothetical protein